MTVIYQCIADRVTRLARDVGGPTTVEYAIMLALIVLVAVAAIASIGVKGASTYNELTSGLPTGS